MPRRARVQGSRRAAEDQARRVARLRGRAAGDREVVVASHDVIVLGGGAAGLFCAIEAGKRGRRAVVLEGQTRVGRKIEISGGGRCNFTNRVVGAEHFHSDNPDFARSALARYGPDDFIALVDRHGIRWHEKTLGQLFCDGSSREVIALLAAECRDAGVDVRTGCAVGEVSKGDRFRVESSLGAFEADALVVATGGLSIAKLGASDLGYRIAERFGLRIVPPRPGLVPLCFGAPDIARWSDLAGVSFPARVAIDRTEFREAGLFTHRGLSGPAFLQISSVWREGREIVVDLLPDRDVAAELLAAQDRSVELANFLAGALPRRLASRWCEVNGGSRPLRAYSTAELEAIAARLHRWPIAPEATEGYGKAEVTVRGVDTAELSSKTLMARRVSGLFFVGEVVDVTGHLGGYNFQWAWSSGWAAGQAV